MPDSSRRSQRPRRSGKTVLPEIRELSGVSQPPEPEPEVDLAMQAEVEACMAQYQQERPEEFALAWAAGVYNPLAQVDLVAVGARYPEPEEEDWLAVARMIGWLLVEEGMDALYFTAPPPTFALEQADWYVRWDLTTFLESPILLREVVRQYPIPVASIRGVIDRHVVALGWQPEQLEQLIQELFERPAEALQFRDWVLLLFEFEFR